MHNLFGTDGIRGHMGRGIFIPATLIQLGAAIARWAHKKYQHPPRILLASDTRISCDFVKAAIKTGLLSYDVRIVDAGVLPTPALVHLMKAHQTFDCAIMISASHNPYHDNGIKIIDAKTGKLNSEDEIYISTTINSADPTQVSYGTDTPWHDASQNYCTLVTQLFSPHFLAGIRIVLDTAHGATYHVAPAIFSKLGAEVIIINNQPTGYNINDQCGALHTEQLAQSVLTNHAHIGFAFDGDGDRVIAVTKRGELRNGDDILALLLQHPAYLKSPAIVGTIMSNEGFAHHVRQQKKELVRTPVGDKHITEHLQTHDLLLGGEPSGHIILNDIIHTGDGILVALRLLEVIQKTNNWNFETFTHYPQVMINLPVSARRDLTTSPFAAIIHQAEEDLQTGRILVRYSGTENVLRVMVETDTIHKAQTVCSHLVQELSQAL